MAIDVEAMMAQYSVDQLGYEDITEVDPYYDDCPLDTREAAVFPLEHVLMSSGWNPDEPLTADSFCDLYEKVTTGYDQFRQYEDTYRTCSDMMPEHMEELFVAKADIVRYLCGTGHRLLPILVAFEERGFSWDHENPYKRIKSCLLGQSSTLLHRTLKTPEQVQAFGDFCRKYKPTVPMDVDAGMAVPYARVREYLVEILGVRGKIRPTSVAYTVTGFGGKLMDSNRRVIAKPEWMK